MDFNVNGLDVVFFQRKKDNSVYEQVNISGSSAVFYLDNNGILTAGNILEVLKTGGTSKSYFKSYTRSPIIGETIYSVDTVTVGSPNRLTKYSAIPGATQAFKISETQTHTIDSPNGIAIGKTDTEPSVNATLDVSGSVIITGSLIVTGLINGGSGSFGGTSLTTGSTYPITASYSVSSSYATLPDTINASTIVSNVFIGPLIGHATTATTAIQSIYSSTASIADVSNFSLTASYLINGGGGTSLGTGSTYPITSSVSIESLTATSADFALVSGWAFSSSVSNTSTSSSYANTASYALNAGSSLVTGSTYQITSSQSITSSYALTSKTSSYFYSQSGSGAWRIYVDMATGNLVINYF